MDPIFSFHKTIQGYNHIKKSIPCEDASYSYSGRMPILREEITINEMLIDEPSDEHDETKSYYIAVIADGHGDVDCFRSEKGAQFAVDVVADCFKEFAKSIDEDPSMFDPVQREYMLRHLTDVVVSKWNERIRDDISQHPIEDKDMEKVSSKMVELYKNNEYLSHIYGSTVIGCLLVNNLLIMIQQGDGRCEVIYENGTINQPIPWDDRCFLNVTTSLCDEDSPLSFRHAYIDLEESPIAACFVGSDGIEDSYLNMEGTHLFYRERCLELIDSTPSEFLGQLDLMLPEFSKQGSGDDISIAGIVVLPKIKPLKDLFAQQNKKYPLENLISSNKKKLISMSRGHSILQEKITKLEKECKEQENLFNAIKKEFDICSEKYEEVESQLKDRSKELQKMEEALSVSDSIFVIDEVAQAMSAIKELFNDSLNQGIDEARQAFNVPLYERKREKKKEYNELKKKRKQLAGLINNLMPQLQEANKSYNNIKDDYEKAKKEFLDYDAKKRKIEELLVEAQEELDKLEYIQIDDMDQPFE